MTDFETVVAETDLAKKLIAQHERSSKTWGEFQKKVMSDKAILSLVGRKVAAILVQKSELTCTNFN